MRLEWGFGGVLVDGGGRELVERDEKDERDEKVERGGMK